MSKLIVLLTVILSAVMTSCVKNPGPGGDATGNKVWKMKVSPNFDWKTYSNVECNITSPDHIALVEFSLPNQQEPFASFTVGASISTPILSLPKSVSSVLISYKMTSGAMSTPTECRVIDNKISFAVPQGDSEPVTPVATQVKSLRSRADGEIGKPVDGVINYPLYGYGTLMFEDLWPAYGDFDLNDMVVNYHIQMNTASADKMGQVFINFVIRAVGGAEPYTLYLQLNKVKSDNFYDSFIQHNNEQGTASPTVTQIGTAGNPLLLRLDNIRDNKNSHTVGTGKGSFVNTSRGFELAEQQLIKFDLYFDFHEPVSWRDLTLDDFNFFIGKEQIKDNATALKEIHQGDMPASEFGAITYETLSKTSINTNNSNRAYRSNDNIVWSVNIADGMTSIPHAYEDVADFLEAYPRFRSWAQTNGAIDWNWYKYPVEGKTVTVK